jgi:hypothetical protein
MPILSLLSIISIILLLYFEINFFLQYLVILSKSLSFLIIFSVLYSIVSVIIDSKTFLPYKLTLLIL